LSLPNYTQLPKLADEFRSRGLEILAFPSPQFKGGKQSGEKLRNIFECKEIIHWFETGHVNGKNTREIYSFLKRELPGDYKRTDVSWNFAKFLIDSDGKPFKRYDPIMEPLALRDDIEHLLKLKEKRDAEMRAIDAERRAKEMMKEVKDAEKKAKEAEKKAAKIAVKEAKLKLKQSKKIETQTLNAEQRARSAEEQIKEAQERIKDANKRSQNAGMLIEIKSKDDDDE